MAMIEVSRKTVGSRQESIYLDTDDLSQEDYCAFRRLQQEGKRLEALIFISKKLGAYKGGERDDRKA